MLYTLFSWQMVVAALWLLFLSWGRIYCTYPGAFEIDHFEDRRDTRYQLCSATQLPVLESYGNMLGGNQCGQTV